MHSVLAEPEHIFHGLCTGALCALHAVRNMETLPASHISHHFQKASDIHWLPAHFLKKIKVLVLRKSTRKDSCWFDITVAVNPWVKTLPSLANNYSWHMFVSKIIKAYWQNLANKIKQIVFSGFSRGYSYNPK